MQNTVVIWKQVQVLQINKYINIYIYIYIWHLTDIISIKMHEKRNLKHFCVLIFFEKALLTQSN